MFSKYLKQSIAGLLLATITFAAVAEERLNQIENAYQAADIAALTKLVETAQGANQYVAQYRLGSMALGTNQRDNARTLLVDLKNNLDAETQTNPGNAEAWALLSSTYGMLTTLEQEKTTEYGGKAAAAEGQALATGANNPMVMLLVGINKFYTPEQWGGGKNKAMEYFERAVTAYKSGDLERVWGYADALIWRGTTHAELGDKEKAKADIEAAIKMEPDYLWAKYVLTSL